jgi:hypothetical protein
MKLILEKRYDATRNIVDHLVKSPSQRGLERITRHVRTKRMEDEVKTRKEGAWFNNFLLDRTVIQNVEDAGAYSSAWARGGPLDEGPFSPP